MWVFALRVVRANIHQLLSEDLVLFENFPPRNVYANHQNALYRNFFDRQETNWTLKS